MAIEDKKYTENKKRKKYVLIQKNWQQIHCQHRQSRRNRKCTECFLQGEKNPVGLYQRYRSHRRTYPPFLQSADKSL